MTVVLIAHAVRYARNVPLAEDWNLVPVLAGDEPDFWSWVWSQNNEHRLPTARLLHLGLLEVTRDFRAGMVFDILLTAGLAAAFVLAARQIRGRTSVVDAFFPLLLLHLGNWENLLWSWQMQFVIVTVLVGLLLVLITTTPLPMPPRVAWAAGALLVMLPLGGGTALAMVPAGAAALGSLVLLSPTSRASRRVVLGAAVASGVLVGVYFIGWERPPWYPDNPGPGSTLRTTAKALTLGWGPGVDNSWPLAGVATVVVLGSAAFVLVRALQRSGVQQPRVLAVGFFAAGTGLTALAIGYGRAALVPTEGLPDRYALAAAPALIAAWFAWALFGPSRLRVVVQGGFLVAVMLLLPLNVQKGYDWRDWYTDGMDAVERDIDAGMPREELARRHHGFLMHWNAELLSWRMELLRREEIGPLADLEPPPESER
ncbi:MAG: hypothetical protein ACRDY6_10705 [Acidimicrobiia bacterium]